VTENYIDVGILDMQHVLNIDAYFEKGVLSYNLLFIKMFSLIDRMFKKVKNQILVKVKGSLQFIPATKQCSP
jgi:hypothetical protein